MFKQAFGSPRLGAVQQEQQISILSPRNFLKMITTSIGDFRKNNLSTPTHQNYQQFISTFRPYLQTFEEEYSKYQASKNRRNKCNRNEQLQLQLKINRIPTIYFTECQQFQLQLCKRAQARKKQQELPQYLDQIELALFSKAGKYPQKSQIILENMTTLDSEADKSLSKVIEFRRKLKEKIIVVAKKQLKVNQVQEKIKRIKVTLGLAELMKKMKRLKESSLTDFNDPKADNEDILLQVKKSDLEHCNKFVSLKTIVKNVEGYRKSMKQKLYKQFLSEIEYIFSTLLRYDKQEWKNINVPKTIFGGQDYNNMNLSHNNITILDQSYFAFEAKQVNIVGHTSKDNYPAVIQEENSQDNNCVLDLSKIIKLWSLIKQFDLYDEEEVNQKFTMILVRHNIQFNNDMEEYITSLYNNSIKETQSTNILKGPQTYAALKGKMTQKIDSKTEIGSGTNLDSKVATLQSKEDKIKAVDMKLFIKIVKFQYQLIKKILTFLHDYRQLQFLSQFKPKLTSFIEGIITFFANSKKVSHDMTLQDFLVYLQIIYYWQHEEFYQVISFCEKLRQAKIDEYLTSMQKSLLIRQLKQGIEHSTYLPINLSSNHYMTFHSLLSPNSSPYYYEDDVNLSMTLQFDHPQTEEEVILRLINKNIIYKDKTYRICDSFLQLIQNLEKYKKLKDCLPQFQENIEEKICQLIGFYAWYNQKNLINSKAGTKTLKNYCTFYSTLLLLKEIVDSLGITNKKIEKTRVQLNDCETQISKSITMTPFMTIQYQISQIYESKIATKAQVPTAESQKILDILKISLDCLKEYFPIEYEDKLHQSLIVKFMQTTFKLISKNYFGYLANMEKRGLAQIKWFLPRLRTVAEITMLRENNLVNKKGELLCQDGSATFCLFNQEIEDMEKRLRLKLGNK